MTDVWVLSDEAPFADDEESGGVVVGVFTTPAAALLHLAGTVIGLEALREIVWTPWALDAYEGRGHGHSIYILLRHPVQDEMRQRQDLQDWSDGTDPVLALSAAELLVYLTAPDAAQHQRQMTAWVQRQRAKEPPCSI